MERVDEEIKGDVIYWAAFYEHRLRLGSKPIFHLEGQPSVLLPYRRPYLTPALAFTAFCARIMSVYKRESRVSLSARAVSPKLISVSRRAPHGHQLRLSGFCVPRYLFLRFLQQLANPLYQPSLRPHAVCRFELGPRLSLCFTQQQGRRARAGTIRPVPRYSAAGARDLRLQEYLGEPPPFVLSAESAFAHPLSLSNSRPTLSTTSRTRSRASNSSD